MRYRTGRKAAGIDVASRRALEEGLDVVFLDNVPIGVEDDDPVTTAIRAADLAEARFDG
jgi:predicted GTPase